MYKVNRVSPVEKKNTCNNLWLLGVTPGGGGTQMLTHTAMSRIFGSVFWNKIPTHGSQFLMQKSVTMVGVFMWQNYKKWVPFSDNPQICMSTYFWKNYP